MLTFCNYTQAKSIRFKNLFVIGFKSPELGISFLKMTAKQKNSGGLSDDRIEEAKEAFSLFDNIGLILCTQALVSRHLFAISA